MKVMLLQKPAKQFDLLISDPQTYWCKHRITLKDVPSTCNAIFMNPHVTSLYVYSLMAPTRLLPQVNHLHCY